MKTSEPGKYFKNEKKSFIFMQQKKTKIHKIFSGYICLLK